MTDEASARAERRASGTPPEGLLGALKGAWQRADRDNAGVVAAGVAYYAFLALVPLLAALVLIYGLVADQATVAAHGSALAETLPGSAAQLVTGQLEAATRSADGTKGLGLLVALGLALFGARKGAGAIVTALNIAYGIDDSRGFVARNLLALAMTGGAAIGLALVGAVLTATGLLPGLLAKLLGYGVVFLAALGAAWLLYRLAPDRSPPPAKRQVPGALLFAAGALLATALFGIYVANFGNYNATYGSLGAVVVLLTWLYMVAFLLLLGAELNAPAEGPARHA